MPRPIDLKTVLKTLKRNSFELISQKGSHAKFKNSSGRPVIVKTSKKQIPHGTFQSILIQSGLKESDFRK